MSENPGLDFAVSLSCSWTSALWPREELVIQTILGSQKFQESKQAMTTAHRENLGVGSQPFMYWLGFILLKCFVIEKGSLTMIWLNALTLYEYAT